MLNALLQLIGLAPRDRREVWNEVPVVILNAAGEITFSGPADVEYWPDPTQYEHGRAEIFDCEKGERVASLKITRQTTNSRSDLDLTTGLYIGERTYRRRESRTGLTAKGTDAKGESFTVYVGRHATAFTLSHAKSVLGVEQHAPLSEEPAPEEVLE